MFSVLQQWEVTGRTCGRDTETDNGDGTITVMVRCIYNCMQQ